KLEIPECTLEDVKVKTCFVSPSNRAKEWRDWSLATENGTTNIDSTLMPKTAEASFKYNIFLDGQKKFLEIPSRLRELATEFFFFDDPSLICNCLLRSPVDVR
ncbi:Actin- protein 10, partial [Cichlidogyrus casuarinus]